MSGPHLVFAYGSNLDLDDLQRWLRARGYPPWRPRSARVATLPGWRMVWNYHSPMRRGGCANIERAAGGPGLPGAVLDVDDGLLAALDHKEGHPERYRRLRCPVQLIDHSIEAWVYVVTPEWRRPQPVWPRRDYLETVLRGARAFGLPSWHVDALSRTPVAEQDR